MTKKKITINAENIQPQFIVGLITNESIYQLCWKINHIFSISLTEEQQIIEKKTLEDSLSYTYLDEFERSFVLAQNKYNNHYLLKKEHHKIDYIFMIFGELDKNEKQSIIQKLKDSKIFTLIFPLDQKAINQLSFNL